MPHSFCVTAELQVSFTGLWVVISPFLINKMVIPSEMNAPKESTLKISMQLVCLLLLKYRYRNSNNHLSSTFYGPSTASDYPRNPIDSSSV